MHLVIKKKIKEAYKEGNFKMEDLTAEENICKKKKIVEESKK